MAIQRLQALAFSLMCGSVAAGSQAQTYTFLKVADSAADDFDPFTLGAPSLSDNGYVAFKARTSDKSSSRILRTGVGLGLPFELVVDTDADPQISSVADTVAVNEQGQVAFWATITGPIDERIVRAESPGGPYTTIAQASDDDQFSFMSVVVSINDGGLVAWQGEINELGFPQGLFTGDGSSVSVVFSTASSPFTSSFAGPALNNEGQIAFRASSSTSGGDAIFRYDPAGDFVTIASSGGLFSAAFDDEPDINVRGAVAAKARSTDLSTEHFIVGDGNGSASSLVDTTGPLDFFHNTSINDAGEIAFAATFDDFVTAAIFSGPNLEQDRVIGTGDPIDGSTVAGLTMYRDGLNNAGQIAFVAQLTDGRAVVVVALPVGCRADFNGDTTVNSQDFFDFLTVFLAEDARADFNNDQAVNSQDLFDFLTAFFLGCG